MDFENRLTDWKWILLAMRNLLRLSTSAQPRDFQGR